MTKAEQGNYNGRWLQSTAPTICSFFARESEVTRQMGMTIDEFIEKIGGLENVDQIYVNDDKGNEIVALGTVKFESVTMLNFTSPCVTFIIKANNHKFVDDGNGKRVCVE